MPRRLYLVRHAQHAGQGRIAGPESPLTALGRRQARALARRLRGLDVCAVYSSPYRRALETARLLADALGTDVSVDERLREWEADAWTGLSAEELDALPDGRRPALDPHFAPPGGESAAEVQRRAQEMLDAVRRRHRDGNVLLVSHSGVLSLMVFTLLGQPMEAWGRVAFVLDHASLTVVEEGGFLPHPVVLCYNDTCHLRGLS
ncbi:MAG TPA: histidine phosphatase family protein [Dehalococcoidia bacterium]|nr:histidine phosphatase family protein [Dehalococcoidia bacterium]